MKPIDSCDGRDLREMFNAGTGWLEKNAADVDALNVFPVPDGDTGTNMLLTMRSTMEEAFKAVDAKAYAVAQAMAQGALMGARGNSGVILSQIFRGLARGLDGKGNFTAADLAAALKESSSAAYKGLSRPVEGTMLTVMQDIARSAQEALAKNDSDIVFLMEAIVAAARESVARTPTLLPVLRQAGVVDAGGQGLYAILEGALYYLKGNLEELKYRRPQVIASSIPLAPQLATIEAREEPYGYCTEFMAMGAALNLEKMRKRLKRMGESLLVVGDEKTARVHVHTMNPGRVLRYGTSLGTLHQIKVQNMDDQHEDFLELQKERGPAVDIAIVAVVSGKGLAGVFQSLGASVIVPGGQTMNPSTKELLRGIEAAPSEKVIFLPNNSNIVGTAEQAKGLTRKTVVVVPTETIPQGAAALLAFNYGMDMETNARNMKEAKSRVKSLEFTRAVRSSSVNGLKVNKGHAIALLDGNLVSAGKDMVGTIKKTLEKVGASKAEVITMYTGLDAKDVELQQVTDTLHELCPEVQLEVIEGGQPYYHYIFSVE